MLGDEVHLRQFDDLHMRVQDDGDGMTVEALVVPYRREIEAVDITPDGVRAYREVFERGSCARAVKAPNRVGLTYLHDETFGATLGYGVAFREDDDGLAGRFRLYASTAAKARDVLGSSHRSVSVGFTSVNPRAGSETEGALVVRRSVVVRHAAAVPQGQYAEARILALRERDDDDLEQASEHDEEQPEGVVEAAQRELENARWLEWADDVAAQQQALRARFEA